MRVPKARREMLLDEWGRSGGSAAQFADYVGIKYSTLANWIQKRRKQAGLRASLLKLGAVVRSRAFYGSPSSLDWAFFSTERPRSIERCSSAKMRFTVFMFSYAYDHTPVVEVASIDEGYFDLKGNRKRLREGGGGAHSDRDPSEPENLGVRRDRPKQAGQRCGEQAQETILLHRNPGWPRAGVPVSSGKQMAARGWASDGKNAQPSRPRSDRPNCRNSPQQLSLFAGKGARQLWEFARGIDDRLVVPEAPAAKSWSSQETFTEDVTDEDWVLAKLRFLADRLFSKVRAEGKTIRTIEVRLRYNDFDDCRRSESLEEPTDLETDCYSVLSRLLKKAWQRRVSLRLVSVKLSGVYGVIFQCGLPLLNAGFDSAQRRRLSPILDRIKGRYGNGAIMRGHDLWLKHA